MKPAHEIVFLFDVDNTLLDNDRVLDDLRSHIGQFGAASADRYWTIFEELRSELGYADYLGALQRYRQEEAGGLVNDPRLLLMSSFLVDYPFANRLYPGSLDAIEHCRRWGPTVILTDGDVVFQPRKVQCAGLWEAVDGRVLIYVHKEKMLDDVERRYPARHYVMVDDKLRILAAMKNIWSDRLTTVFPRQGHYALDPRIIAEYPAADLTLERIGDLVECDLPVLLRGAAAAGRTEGQHSEGR
jgi:FMN phosphatase YigB (HAD superfamily)